MRTLAILAIAFVVYAAVLAAILAVGGEVGLGYVLTVGGFVATAVGLVERFFFKAKPS